MDMLIRTFCTLLCLCSLHSGVTSSTTTAASAAPSSMASLKQEIANFAYERRHLVWKALSQERDFLHGESGSFSLKRFLEVGDFEDFNEIFRSATINLPDTEVSTDLLFTLTLDIYNLRCTGLAIGDVLINYQMESNSRFKFSMDVIDLDLTCFLDYDYKYSLARGSGSADAYTADNQASLALVFQSDEGFNNAPPDTTTVDSCLATINVSDLDFDGGFVNSILNAFERLLRGTVEKEVRDTVCGELSSIGTDLVDPVLQFIEEALQPFLGKGGRDRLGDESSLAVPENVKLVNFQETSEDDSIGKWLNVALDEVESIFTSRVADPGGPAGDSDFGINTMMRDFLLEDDRSLTIDLANLPIEGIGGVIYDGHDKLTETRITLNKVKLVGLDSITKFEPLVDIGAHTLRNIIVWRYLVAELDLTIEFKPSSLPDSILENPDQSIKIEESVTIDFGVDDLEVDISVLLAINQNTLGDLEVGPLLSTENLLGCILSTLYQVAVSSLDVKVGNIREPTLNGFVSKGIDRVVTDVTMAVFMMYEAVVLKAMPGIFQTTVRDVINNDILAGLLGNPDNTDCPGVSFGGDGLVDFRDLLLDASSARDMGGLGTEPYGDVGRILKNLVSDQFLAPDERGLPRINNILIAPFTERQSGIPGLIKIDKLFSVVKDPSNISEEISLSVIRRFELAASDLSVSNLDTLTMPMFLLEPTDRSDGQALNNMLNLGPVDGRAVNATVRILWDIGDETSPLYMRNLFDVSFSIPASLITAKIRALVDQQSLSDFPLRDLLDWNCWLSIMPAVQIDSNGNRVDESEQSPFSLKDFLLQVTDIGADVHCAECTSTGAPALLPNLLSIMESTGSVDFFRSRIEDFVEEFTMNDWIQLTSDQFVSSAPKLCPSHPSYDENYERPKYDISFPPVSKQWIETVVYAGGLAAGLTLVPFVESHRLKDVPPTDPLSGQKALVVKDGEELLNWMDLSPYLGSFADSAFEQIRKYLNEPRRENARNEPLLGFNSLLLDYLLEDDGALEVNFNDLGFEGMGLDFEFSGLRITGLASATSVDMLRRIANQTLGHSITFEHIGVELILAVDVGDGLESLTVRLEFKEVALDIATLLAIDNVKVGEIVLGSVLRAGSTFPCILSTVSAFEATEIIASVGSVSTPELNGYLSEEVHAQLNKTIDQMFRTYQQNLVDGMSLVLGDTGRNIANVMLNAYMTIDDNAVCPTGLKADADSLVDFRDLFLSAEEAAAAGASGTEPYGNLGATLMDLLETELLSPKSGSDEPGLNDAVVRPWTESQSGVEGRLLFEGELANVGSGEIEQLGIKEVTFSMADILVENLDHIGFPLTLLDPNRENGQQLDNYIVFGANGNPLKAGVSVVLGVDGDPAFEMRNEMTLGIDVSKANLDARFIARLRELPFLNFPLRDVANVDCWLAALVSYDLDEDGRRPSGFDPSLAISFLEMAVEDIDFNLACTNCSSPGMVALPDVIETLNDGGVVDKVKPFVVNFTTELIKTDYVQTLLDRLVADAEARCPHMPGFVSENATSPSYPGVGFPGLSAEGIESAVYAGAVVAQTASVLLAKAYENDTVVTYPLSAQENFEAGDDLLLDFRQLNTTIGDWAVSAVEEANKYLGSEVDDAFGPNGRDLGINKLLRGSLLDDKRALSINFDELAFGEGDVVAYLTEVRIKGIDTFTEFDAFDPIAPQTFSNAFGWKELGVELLITVKEEGQEPEVMTVAFGLNDVSASMSLFLAIDQEDLGSLQLGSLLVTDEILACLLSTAKGVEMTELNVSAGSIHFLRVSGFISQEVAGDIDEATKVLMTKYEQDILGSMPQIFDKPVRTMANNWLTYYLNQDASVTCAYSLFDAGLDFHVDLRDLLLPAETSLKLGGSGMSQYGNVFRNLKELVTVEVLDKKEKNSAESTVNSLLIAPLTKSQSDVEGTLKYPGDLFNTETQIEIGGFNAIVELRASEGRIENLDTIGQPLSILDPLQDLPYNLDNTASFGVADRPLRLAVRLLIGISNDEGASLRNEIDVSIDLSAARVLLEAFMKIAEKPFMEFPLRDMLNLDCWIATLPPPMLDARGIRLASSSISAALVNLDISIEDLNLNVTCVSCTSPRMEDLEELLMSEVAQDEAKSVTESLLDYGVKLMEGNFMQSQIDRFINSAAKKCPHSPQYDPSFVKAEYEDFEAVSGKSDNVVFLLTLFAAIGGVILAVIIVMISVKCVVGRRNRKWLRGLPKEKVMVLSKLQRTEDAREDELNRQTSSMFTSPDIPLWLRYFIPVVILGNVGFFLSGHLSLGASVTIEATLAGEKIAIGDFFEFSMAKSTLDIWNAGGKQLAILILLFSGVWPYTKQFVTLFLWFAPPGMVSTSRRGSIFLWLDALGKYSMVDIFVLVLSIVAFKISIESPEVAFLPDDFYSIKMLVVPLWGLYANMIAQLISQVSSHYIIHYHRRIVEVASKPIDSRLTVGAVYSMHSDDAELASHTGSSTSGDNEPTVLKEHAFARPHRGETDHLRVRGFISKLPIVLASIMTILVVVGSILPSFSLELLGILGVAVESGMEFQRQAKFEHSIFTVVGVLMDEAAYLGTAGDYLGLGTLSALFVLTVMVVPVLQGLGVLRAWYKPLTPKQRNRTAIFVETMQAWQYVEVYLLALVVAAWQLGPVSEFMIEPYCESLRNTFATMVYYGVLDKDDAQCFKVAAEIENATYLLIVGAVMLILLNTFVMKAVVQYLRDDSATLRALGNTKMDIPMDDREVEEARQTLRPNPVLFSDTFRWCLVREDDYLTGSSVSSDLGHDSAYLTEAEAECPPLRRETSSWDDDLYTEGGGSVALNVTDDTLHSAEEESAPSSTLAPPVFLGTRDKDVLLDPCGSSEFLSRTESTDVVDNVGETGDDTLMDPRGWGQSSVATGFKDEPFDTRTRGESSDLEVVEEETFDVGSEPTVYEDGDGDDVHPYRIHGPDEVNEAFVPSPPDIDTDYSIGMSTIVTGDDASTFASKADLV